MNFNITTLHRGFSLFLLRLIAALTLLTSPAFAESQWVKGFELGIEDLLETDENGDKLVRNTLARAQMTLDKQLWANENGDSIEFESKFGGLLGKYKGSYQGDFEYGTLTEARFGVTGDAVGYYSKNIGSITPFIGAGTALEFTNRERLEWQVDAIAGAKFNVSDDKDVRVTYRKPVSHGMRYTGEDLSFDQDDGYAVGLLFTKKATSGKTHGVRLEYEHFDKGDSVYIDEAGKAFKTEAFEPKTRNILVSYRVTF